jgi:hypothetical protein
MFKKMSHPILVIVFHERTYILDDIKTCPFFRLGVFTDIISNPVRKFSISEFRVFWNQSGRWSLRDETYREHQIKENNKGKDLIHFRMILNSWVDGGMKYFQVLTSSWD